jgi:hypothetical protein
MEAVRKKHGEVENCVQNHYDEWEVLQYLELIATDEKHGKEHPDFC